MNIAKIGLSPDEIRESIIQIGYQRLLNIMKRLNDTLSLNQELIILLNNEIEHQYEIDHSSLMSLFSYIDMLSRRIDVIENQCSYLDTITEASDIMEYRHQARGRWQERDNKK